MSNSRDRHFNEPQYNETKCPLCDGPTKCLGGHSAHPRNWYCDNQKGCGWRAWVSTTENKKVKEQRMSEHYAFNGKHYKDIDGNDCTLHHLIKKEPHWAYNRIKAGEEALAMKAEVEHLESLRHSADMRAIKRWQEGGEGRDLIWPDRADNMVWLLEQLEQKEESLREAKLLVEYT